MKKISSSILMVIACVGISFAQQKTIIIKSDALVAPVAPVTPVVPPANVTPPVPPVPPTVVKGPAKQVKIIRMEKNGDRKMRASKKMRRNNANENTVMIYSDGKVNIDSLIKLDTTQISILNKKIVIIGDQEVQQIYFEKDTLGDFFDHEEFNKEFNKDFKGRDFNFPERSGKGYKKNRSNGDRKAQKSAKKFKDDRGGLELSIGYNAWLDNGSTALSLSNNNLELINSKSTHVNLSYVNYFKIYKNFIQFSAGVGIDWNNYRFSKNITLSPKSDSMNLVVDNINYSKNKLMAKYVTVPLQLHFATKPNKKGDMLGVAGGVELGYLLNGRQKQISEEKGKQKIDDDYNLADLRLGYTLCANYGNTGIYAKYYPNSTFKETQGPNLNTFCIGFKFGLD